MMANGKKKAPVIRRILNENISTDFPATLMRQHKNALLMIDEEAASELEKQAV
jgi:6-phosphogluconolactonase/glucosamine-6-phosphate isomerase/deaminase